jgi:hypothetical protein
MQPLEYAQPVEYMQPLEYAQPMESSQTDGWAWSCAAAGALLVGAAALARSRGESVAEPNLDAAAQAARVAMLFTSGRSAKSKKPVKKAAPSRGGFFGGGSASAKKPARAPAVDDDDLFVHEGTKGFTGDDFAFVYRTGQAS